MRPARLAAGSRLPAPVPAALLAAALWAALPARGAAQEPELGWSFTSELSAVISEGNAESLTLGMGATAIRRWTSTELRFDAKALRTEASRKTRTATGTSDDFEIIETKVREKTAGAANLSARLDRTLSNGVFAFGGLDWLRNTFAGVDGRFLMALGAGSTLVEEENLRLKVDLAGTYTFQEDVVENPFVKNSFPGLRSGILFWRRISGSAESETQLTTDWNVQETDDLRLDGTTALSVAVTSVVALKPSLQLLWRNRPSLTSVQLFAPDGSSTGESVNVPLEKLDLFFRVALVVTL